VIAELTKLGLTSYEAKAYIALTSRGSSTAAEVARLAGVPRQRIYDVLASLVGKGLAISRPGTVVRYAATPPDTALEHLLADRRQELADLERAAEAMVERLSPAFEAGQAQTDPLEYIEVLRDRRAINARFGELQADIEDEILVFTKPPYATPVESNVDGVEVARSHEARSVYEFSIFDTMQGVEGVRRFVSAGEQARFVSDLPLKLVIIDESIVMFGMEDPIAGSSELTIVVIEHPQLAKVLKIAFESVWAAGLTFEQAHEQLVAGRGQKTA
jgi:HTH-type transcriptional regulator, sugar sensing transcriptional regulator